MAFRRPRPVDHGTHRWGRGQQVADIHEGEGGLEVEGFGLLVRSAIGLAGAEGVELPGRGNEAFGVL